MPPAVPARRHAPVWRVLVALPLAALACALFGGGGTQEPGPTPTASGFLSSASGGEVHGPDGVVFAAEPGALSADTTVTITDAGAGVPFADASPLDVVSPEYEVDLGGAEAVGSLTLTIPINQANAHQSPIDRLTDNRSPGDQSIGNRLTGSRQASPPAASSPVYVGQTYSDEGYPMMLGVMVENDMATMPVYETGFYQLYEITPFFTTIYDPLHVPSYAQFTPAWCSPTALTDLVQFHQGAWPAGGDGSVWGESSNWYLAGQAGQPFDTGYFFHWLINAGGFAGVPGDVKQSFTLNDLEVMIWFTGQVQAPWNEYVWNAFRAYVESYVWGENMSRRPVAWGSSIAGHSRTITGSDGTNFFYNETGNGSINLSKTWQDYHDDAVDLDQDEVIDTTVIFHDPRPESQRRGVLWLYPQQNFIDGSVVVHDGNGTPTSYWHWDGTDGRDLGYYYDDPLSVHTTDGQLDVAFVTSQLIVNPADPPDYITYEFKLANIGGASYDYHVLADLYPDGAPPGTIIGNHSSPAIAPKGTWGPEGGSFPIGDLTPGMYVLRFRLYQAGVLQDVKYVKFRIAPPDQLNVGPLIPINPIIPFEDPELSTHNLYYRGQNCGPKTIMFDIQATDPEGANAYLFFRLKDGDHMTEFNPGVAMRPLGDGAFTYELMAEDVPDFLMFENAMLQYQFVLTNAAGEVLGRSEVFGDVTFQVCHR